MATTVHTYIRCGNEIYVGDAAEQWRMLHRFETEKRAKRWQRDQEKLRPGSVTVGKPPVSVTRNRIDTMKAEYDRRREIARLAAQQALDQRRQGYHTLGRGTPAASRNSTTIGLSGKTAQLAQAYVAPDRDASSFLRERSKKRVTSRNARNTRATYGGS